MRHFIALTLFVLITTSCNVIAPTPTPTPTATATATATPNLEATATAEAQVTLTAQAIASATTRAQSTATAQAQATARAKSTADAIAQATQTARALVAAIDTLAATGKRAYFSDKGNMSSPAPYLSTVHTNLNLRNFVLEVKFLNPGAEWYFTAGFRDGGPYSQYRLVGLSSVEWALIMPTEGLADAVKIRTLAYGRANGTDPSPTGANTIRYVVNDKGAFLFVNGQYVSAMDVSERNTSGDLWIASSLPTLYENFAVYALP
jgi:hypothetical protein